MAFDVPKLVNLVAHGLPNTQVARALGISDGRISQLLDHQPIADLVSQRKQELATEEIEKTTTLEIVSGTLLENIKGLAADCDSLGEAVRAFETIEKIQATKKANSRDEQGEGVGHITLNVPLFVQQNLQIIVSSANEITAIGDRSMAAMPTSSVQKLIKEHQQRDQNKPPIEVPIEDIQDDHETENDTSDYSQERHGKESPISQDSSKEDRSKDKATSFGDLQDVEF